MTEFIREYLTEFCYLSAEDLHKMFCVHLPWCYVTVNEVQIALRRAVLRGEVEAKPSGYRVMSHGRTELLYRKASREGRHYM